VDLFNPFEELKRDMARGRRWGKILARVLTFVFEQTSLAFETILRRGFGEQYLSYGVIARVFVTLFLLWIVVSWERQDLLYFFFALVSIVSLVAARVEIQQRKRRGDQWHSLDNGIPLFTRFFGTNELHVKQWLEPLLVLSLGFVCLLLDSRFLFVLFPTTLYMGVKEFQIQQQLKQHYLNAINARVQGQNTQHLNKVGWQQYFRDRQKQFHQPRQQPRAQGQAPQKPKTAKLTGMKKKP
jgi:hypothetical protein